MSKFVILNREITKTEKCAFQKKNQILKIKFFGQFFLKSWKIFFCCSFGCWKNPYQPKNRIFWKSYIPMPNHCAFGTPIWDPDLGPWMDPDLGPWFGTPIWDPDLGPRFKTPIWDPALDLDLGHPHLGPRFGTPI
jgi:hypothetical protein